MKRLLLVSVLAVGCAHAQRPFVEVASDETHVLGSSINVGDVVLNAPVGDQGPKGTYGATQVAFASATAVFTIATTALPGRNAFNVYNHGPNTIWCGFDSSVTNVTGTPIAAETSLAIDMVWLNSSNKTFWCRADTAIQVTPLDTRWLQVR